MTFSMPEPLAAQFMQRVPSRDRSKFVSDALSARLAERDQNLIRACEIANGDLDLMTLEKDFDAILDPVVGPWI